MIDSLNAIRSLNLAPIFEELYFGTADPAQLLFCVKYPPEFRNMTLKDCEPLTAGGLIPLFSDADFYDIYLYEPVRRKFIVKSLEEPETIQKEFDSWQQFLAYKLLEVADSGPTDEELRTAAEAMGFRKTTELFSLLSNMESLSDSEMDQLEEKFIRSCTG